MPESRSARAKTARRRIREVEGWRDKEVAMHQRRLDYFQEEIERAQADCPHVAPTVGACLVSVMKGAELKCPNCGKVL
jgi:ferric-dicitrate binding protein FerR (iron transport regulator)